MCGCKIDIIICTSDQVLHYKELKIIHIFVSAFIHEGGIWMFKNLRWADINFGSDGQTYHDVLCETTIFFRTTLLLTCFATRREPDRKASTKLLPRQTTTRTIAQIKYCIFCEDEKFSLEVTECVEDCSCLRVAILDDCYKMMERVVAVVFSATSHMLQYNCWMRLHQI